MQCALLHQDLEQKIHSNNYNKYNRYSGKNAPWGVNCAIQIFFFFFSGFVVDVDKKPAHKFEFNSSHWIFFLFLIVCVCVLFLPLCWILLIPLFIVSFIFQYDAHALSPIDRQRFIWISSKSIRLTFDDWKNENEAFGMAFQINQDISSLVSR